MKWRWCLFYSSHSTKMSSLAGCKYFYTKMIITIKCLEMITNTFLKSFSQPYIKTFNREFILCDPDNKIKRDVSDGQAHFSLKRGDEFYDHFRHEVRLETCKNKKITKQTVLFQNDLN